MKAYHDAIKELSKDLRSIDKQVTFNTSAAMLSNAFDASKRLPYDWTTNGYNPKNIFEMEQGETMVERLYRYGIQT